MTGIQLLQEFIALGLRATMLPDIVREVFQRNRVTIIAYHKMPAPLFEKHIKFLLKRYSIISLGEFIKAKYQNNIKGLPVKPLIITFDDGAKINHTLKEVFRKYNIPTTLFVCSDIIGTNHHFWFSYRNRVKMDLKKVTDTVRLKLLSQVGFNEKQDYDIAEALSEVEVYDLLRAGIDIQSHTLTHPILPMCEDSKAEIEIAKSRIDLENEFGVKICCFAYPNGNYLPRDIEICKKAGYLAAVTMDPGFNGSDTDVYRLKRISICDNASISQLAVRTSGVWNFAKGIFKPETWRTELPIFSTLNSGGWWGKLRWMNKEHADTP